MNPPNYVTGKFICMSRYLLSLLLFAFGSNYLFAKVTVTARFDPDQGIHGQKVRYIVTVTESGTDALPELEPIESLPMSSTAGLDLQNARLTSGKQGRFQFNDTILYQNSMSAVMDVSAPKPGSYTIPSYKLAYKGAQYDVPSATLFLRERRESDGPTIDEMLFIEADFPDTIYLGERRTIPMKLYVLDGVRTGGISVSIELPTASPSVNYPKHLPSPESSAMDALIPCSPGCWMPRLCAQANNLLAFRS